MDVEKVIDYPGENEGVAELLNDEQIIGSVIWNEKEDDSIDLELVGDVLNSTITLRNFLIVH